MCDSNWLPASSGAAGRRFASTEWFDRIWPSTPRKARKTRKPDGRSHDSRTIRVGFVSSACRLPDEADTGPKSRTDPFGGTCDLVVVIPLSNDQGERPPLEKRVGRRWAIRTGTRPRAEQRGGGSPRPSGSAIPLPLPSREGATDWRNLREVVQWSHSPCRYAGVSLARLEQPPLARAFAPLLYER